MDDLALLRLLQIADSSFPSGGFAFSNGLEGLVDLGLLSDAAAVEAAIRAQIEEGLAGIDLPIGRHAHRAAGQGDLPGLVELDALCSALRPVLAFQTASIKTGRRFLESAVELAADPWLAELRALMRAGRLDGHLAVTFGAVAARIAIPEAPALLAFGSFTLHGQTAAAVRLGLIGQRAAQTIISHLQPALLLAAAHAETLALADLGGYQPLLDLAGLRQPSLDTRLFAS